MTEHYILFRLPLVRAWALQSASTLREGRKLPISYADMELAEAIDRATEAHNASRRK